MAEKIKTALEKALERAASMREASPDEIDRMEFIPQGRSIAGAFMQERDFDINKALTDIPGEKVNYVREGVQEVLLMNISLGLNESAIQVNRRAMEGILAIKRDRARITRLIGEMDLLLQYFIKTIEQTGERFKREMEKRMRATRGQRDRNRDMETMQFREEWANVVRQISAGYETNLAELKEKVKGID